MRGWRLTDRRDLGPLDHVAAKTTVALPSSVRRLSSTQMQRPKGHGGGSGGPPQPAKPGPPQPGPRHPGPPQPVNCACWTALGAACGVGAALATLASPMAEKPSAPAIAPVPIIFFRVMTIPSSVYFDQKLRICVQRKR